MKPYSLIAVFYTVFQLSTAQLLVGHDNIVPYRRLDL